MESKINSLIQISEYIQSSLNFEEVINLIITCAKDLIKTEAATLFLLTPDNNKLIFFEPQGDCADKLKNIEMPCGQGIVGKCIDTKEIIVINNIDETPDHYKSIDSMTEFKTKQILCVPLKMRDKIIGALEVLNKVDGSDFTDDDITLCRLIANQSAIAIENTRMHEEEVRQNQLTSIGRTVSELAHCIKNVINLMMGGRYFIEKGVENNDVESLKKGWKFFEPNYERLLKLVNDMLYYSKGRKPEYADTDIKQILDEIKELASKSEKNIDIEVCYKDVPETIVIDEKNIYRAILNIVTNAISACSVKDGKINIECSRQGYDCIIKIQDNGCGIPQEYIDKVFDLFFSTKGSGGTGFGLAVVQKIVSEHKGVVKVSSKENVGTCFEIILPIGSVISDQ